MDSKTPDELFEEEHPIQYKRNKHLRDGLNRGSRYFGWVHEVIKKVNKSYQLSGLDIACISFTEWHDDGLTVDQAAPKIIDLFTGGDDETKEIE